MTFEKRLWVDDERGLPKDIQDDVLAHPSRHWDVAHNSYQAVAKLRHWKERIEFARAKAMPVLLSFEEISLDHDLGGGDTAMRIVNWMIRNEFWPKTITVHTANPVGRNNLLRALNAEAPAEVDIFIRYW